MQDSGVCLVIGCHPCWKEDYLNASEKYPEHKICLVNYATNLSRGDYLCTVHGDKIKSFLKLYKHGNKLTIIQRDNEYAVNDYPKLELGSHGGSGVFAAAAMAHIGFDTVIMCGCPITGDGGYAIENKNHNYLPWIDSAHKRVKKWVDGMREFKNNSMLSHKIKSMSGNTKEIFGGV